MRSRRKFREAGLFEAAERAVPSRSSASRRHRSTCSWRSAADPHSAWAAAAKGARGAEAGRAAEEEDDADAADEADSDRVGAFVPWSWPC